MVASELGELLRDSDLLRAKVGSLVSKKAEAEITADLEAKSGPSEFRVLESAQPPALPASPNRPQALMLALIGALVLGMRGVGRPGALRSFAAQRERSGHAR